MRTRPAGTGQAGQHFSFRTTCGREIRIGLLALGDAQYPARRVSLDISPSSGAGGDGTWAGLTVGEARQFAAALLAQATAAEHNEGHGTPSRPTPRSPLNIRHLLSPGPRL